ncbi:MAG: SIR2 family protein [Burkholderiaceae bacterium]|jgi:hypothetical protein|nr:SIR2 family protein [Burkholderiaceae bacterium]
MNNTKKTSTSLSFKAPRAGEWKSLAADQGNEEDQKMDQQNCDELHNILLTSLQMQHLVVLSGSGCSLGAGGPSMGILWDEVVGQPASDAAKEAAEKIGHDIINNKDIEALLSRVEASLQLNDDITLKTFLNESKKKILAKCSDFLYATDDSGLDAHRTFIHRLSRRRSRDQRLKIFTTNYDLCFEYAASILGAIALDGFSFTVPRRFDPRFYGYDIVRRARNGDEAASYLEGVFLLYKLHGSVNWSRGKDGSIYEDFSPVPEKACLIYPASGKYQQSFTQPHLESIAQYLAVVREPNTCVIVAGFGFNDDHLATPLLAAVTSNPHLRLIVVDPSAKNNLSREKPHWKRLNELSGQGEDIWFISAEFAQFAKLIPDLRSLTPAESLMKTIQSVVKPT